MYSYELIHHFINLSSTNSRVRIVFPVYVDEITPYIYVYILPPRLYTHNFLFVLLFVRCTYMYNTVTVFNIVKRIYDCTDFGNSPAKTLRNAVWRWRYTVEGLSGGKTKRKVRGRRLKNSRRKCSPTTVVRTIWTSRNYRTNWTTDTTDTYWLFRFTSN